MYSQWFLFSSPCWKHDIFSSIHWEDQTEFLEVKLTEGRGCFYDWIPLQFPPLGVACTEPPAAPQLQFECSHCCPWKFLLQQIVILCINLSVSNFGSSSLPCDFPSLTDLRVVDCFSLFRCLLVVIDGRKTSKFLTHQTRNRKSILTFKYLSHTWHMSLSLPKYWPHPVTWPSLWQEILDVSSKPLPRRGRRETVWQTALMSTTEINVHFYYWSTWTGSAWI